jgi:hypothetical protein
MKKLIVAMVLVMVASCLIFGQAKAPQKSTAAEQELMKLEKDWGDAAIKRDLSYFERNLADEYTGTDFEATIWTKASSIAALKSGEDVVTSAVVDDMKVRIYADTAVITGRSTVKEQLKGKDITGQYRWTDTWIKRDGRWQCVASHSSKIISK